VFNLSWSIAAHFHRIYFYLNYIDAHHNSFLIPVLIQHPVC